MFHLLADVTQECFEAGDEVSWQNFGRILIGSASNSAHNSHMICASASSCTTAWGPSAHATSSTCGTTCRLAMCGKGPVITPTWCKGNHTRLAQQAKYIYGVRPRCNSPPAYAVLLALAHTTSKSPPIRCHAMVLPGQQSGFRASCWPHSNPRATFDAGRNPARKPDCWPGTTIT